MRTLLLPAKTALLLAIFSGLALTLSVAALFMVDRDARRVAAAEAARHDFEALAEKLPGVLDDPAAAPLLAAAVREVGRYAARTNQPRILLYRDRNGQVSGSGTAWPRLREWRDGYAIGSSGAGTDIVAFVRPLPQGASLLFARPIQSASALRRSLSLWGGGIVLLLTGLSVVTALVVGGQTAARIRRLNEVCDRVAEGDVGQRIAEPGPADEIGILARHMNGMLAELERRIHGLRAASDHIAHDLRTPLARVRARLSTMENSVDEEVSLQASRAAEELERLMAAFNALLELREIEADVGTPATAFDVAEAIETAVDLYEALAEDEKNVRIERDVRVATFLGDRELLVRALANLIDNALKVSPPRGVIHIAALSRMMEGEAALELSVSDDGPGFTTLPVEGDEARSTLGGHGLGLVIVRAIAERHRGTVAVGAGETGARVTLMLRAPRLLIAND